MEEKIFIEDGFDTEEEQKAYEEWIENQETAGGDDND